MGEKLSEILYCIKKESLGSISELKRQLRLFSFCIRLVETGNPLRAGTGLSCVYIQPRPSWRWSSQYCGLNLNTPLRNSSAILWNTVAHKLKSFAEDPTARARVGPESRFTALSLALWIDLCSKVVQCTSLESDTSGLDFALNLSMTR